MDSLTGLKVLIFLMSVTVCVNTVTIPGVCKKDVAYEVPSYIPTKSSYDDYVREPCYWHLFTCNIKRRNVETKMIKESRIEHRTEYECCDGYREDENGVCKPVCLDRCTNGECVAPDTCQCWKGYFMDHTSNHQCHKIPDSELLDKERTSNDIEARVSKLIDNDENHNTRSALLDVSIVGLVLIGICIISYFSYRAFYQRKFQNVDETDLESSGGQIALMKRKFFPYKFSNIVKV